VNNQFLPKYNRKISNFKKFPPAGSKKSGGLAFFPKMNVQVQNVEFSKRLTILTSVSIENTHVMQFSPLNFYQKKSENDKSNF